MPALLKKFVISFLLVLLKQLTSRLKIELEEG
jgi:hypothetical protein